jgi:hypothetical protein
MESVLASPHWLWGSDFSTRCNRENPVNRIAELKKITLRVMKPVCAADTLLPWLLYSEQQFRRRAIAPLFDRCGCIFFEQLTHRSRSAPRARAFCLDLNGKPLA